MITLPENKLAYMSAKFTITILKPTNRIKGHYSLFNQHERNRTSIGANIRNTKYVHSKNPYL